jgi:hypothetical protein
MIKTTPERSVEEILREFQQLSLTFVVGEGVVEHHAKLSNFFLEALQAEREKRDEMVDKAYERGWADGASGEITEHKFMPIDEAEKFLREKGYKSLAKALTKPNNPK